jgi:hypothetical protein
MLLIRLVFLGVDVQGRLIFIVEEFTVESVAEEAADISFAHALKAHVDVSLPFTVFSSLSTSLTPKCSKDVEALFLVVCKLEVLWPIHTLNEVNKAIQSQNEFFHIVN